VTIKLVKRIISKLKGTFKASTLYRVKVTSGNEAGGSFLDLAVTVMGSVLRLCVFCAVICVGIVPTGGIESGKLYLF